MDAMVGSCGRFAANTQAKQRGSLTMTMGGARSCAPLLARRHESMAFDTVRQQRVVQGIPLRLGRLRPGGRSRIAAILVIQN
jgi:hypothetical protein